MEGGREQNYWPGFVDALSNVVLTLVFVLVVFVFALAMSSQQVEKQVANMKKASEEQKAQQLQLENALMELQKLHTQGTTSAAGQAAQQDACLHFNKSDPTQKADVSADGLSVLVFFAPSAITIADAPLKTISDYLEGLKTKPEYANVRFSIEASDNPASPNPLLARETQLGRILNTRNALLDTKILPGNITIHSVIAQQEQGTYDWVKIHAEK